MQSFFKAIYPFAWAGGHQSLSHSHIIENLNMELLELDLKAHGLLGP